jgi:hypothetical protein
VAKKITDAEARKVMRASGFAPLVPYVSSATPWKSKCLKCKKEVSPSFNNVRTKGVRCSFCSAFFHRFRGRDLGRNAIFCSSDSPRKVLQNGGVESSALPFPARRKNCERVAPRKATEGSRKQRRKG